MEKTYITIAEMARRCGAAYMTCWKWCLGGKVDVVRDVRGRISGVEAESAQRAIDLYKARRALAEQAGKEA